MNRALGIAILVATLLASVAAGLVIFKPRFGAQKRPSPPVDAKASRPAGESVLLAGAPDRAVLIRARSGGGDAGRARDGALARALGAAPTTRFVEVVVVNRADADVPGLHVPPVVRWANGAAQLVPLPALAAPPDRRTRQAAMLLAELFPDSAAPIRKGTLRRAVYGLPDVAFEDLVAADAGGLRLVPHATTAPSVERYLERPRADLVAALTDPEDEPR